MKKFVLMTICAIPLMFAFMILDLRGGRFIPESLYYPLINVNLRGGLPSLNSYKTRDEKLLFFRHYQTTNAKGVVVLVHGASGSSTTMHIMAKQFADRGYNVYALDLRGHGASGIKGHIDYIGQLEHDIEDFMKEVKPHGSKTLVGFSAGGGLALRFAGGKTQNLFDNYLLLSPYIFPSSPTFIQYSEGSIYESRRMALAYLNGFGITALNNLNVVKFNVPKNLEYVLNQHYSFALLSNFQPFDSGYYNYKANIAEVKKPMAIVAGDSDEIYYASAFKEVFPNHQVTLIPNIQHIPLTLEKSAIDVIIKVTNDLNKR